VIPIQEMRIGIFPLKVSKKDRWGVTSFQGGRGVSLLPGKKLGERIAEKSEK